MNIKGPFLLADKEELEQYLSEVLATSIVSMQTKAIIPFPHMLFLVCNFCYVKLQVLIDNGLLSCISQKSL